MECCPALFAILASGFAFACMRSGSVSPASYPASDSRPSSRMAKVEGVVHCGAQRLPPAPRPRLWPAHRLHLCRPLPCLRTDAGQHEGCTSAGAAASHTEHAWHRVGRASVSCRQAPMLSDVLQLMLEIMSSSLDHACAHSHRAEKKPSAPLQPSNHIGPGCIVQHQGAGGTVWGLVRQGPDGSGKLHILEHAKVGQGAWTQLGICDGCNYVCQVCGRLQALCPNHALAWHGQLAITCYSFLSL